MKRYLGIVMLLFVFLATGCNEEKVKKVQDSHAINTKLIESYNDIAIQNAIITQHTLYGYHFVENSAILNELGESDLRVLAKHFKDNPGQLNIRKGDISQSLYQSRVDFIVKSLQRDGVDINKINISDGQPGGSGMPSEKVIVIVTEKPTKSTNDGTQSVTGMGTGTSNIGYK